MICQISSRIYPQTFTMLTIAYNTHNFKPTLTLCAADWMVYVSVLHGLWADGIMRYANNKNGTIARSERGEKAYPEGIGNPHKNNGRKYFGTDF